MSSRHASSRPVTSWLVTGASRGIGFELVRQLLASPENLVVAACRNPTTATALRHLQEHARGTLHIIHMDVSDFDSVRASAKSLEPILGEVGLDYLINNAGIATRDTSFTLDPDELLRIVRTNVAGPALVSQTCLPFLQKGKRKVILNISSTAGSLATVEDIGGRHTSYAISKAALNMLTLKQKAERPDIITVTLCPGWVKTDMGGEEAYVDTEESISKILAIIASVTATDSGKFVRYTGETIPW
ncbi:NAD-P-binding protein [Cubamyces sp. BRFM 1775]|nr:NAD-P-binding protein [Cubamyces sp. BRFM 1775]